MKILHLTLKKKWFDMIASGEKKEEYREIKPYWNQRLNKKYDIVIFRNGYSKDSPQLMVELKEIVTGPGLTKWGAPDPTKWAAPESKQVYILKLGKIFNMFDNLTSEKIEILRHRITVHGGFWETLCECGADTFTVESMQHVPSPSGKYKDRQSPTGLVHIYDCGKNIIVHKWHEFIPGVQVKPFCRHCGQDIS